MTEPSASSASLRLCVGSRGRLRWTIPALLLALLILPSCTKKPCKQWGFVATLGNDTTSVERVTQRGNHIVGDAVGRSPTVVRRHWEMTLAPATMMSARSGLSPGISRRPSRGVSRRRLTR